MICEARIATALRDDGVTTLKTIASAPPLTLMPTPGGVHIVGSAAGPLNGDRISLDIYVAPGCDLTVSTVAASLAWPGSSPVPSQFTIRARVARGGSLRWLPEPLVPVAGSRHRVVADIDLAADARLVWREEIVLGRHREEPGELSSLMSIDAAGQPVLRQELSVGPGVHESALLLSDAAAVGSVTLVDPVLAADRQPVEGLPSKDHDHDAAVLELEGPARQIVATAATAARLKNLLDAGAENALATTARTPGTIPRSDHAPAHN